MMKGKRGNRDNQRLFYDSGFYVENLFLVDCEELDDLLAVLEEGMKNRSVGSHMMNEHSSRSHTILTVHITSEQQAESEKSVFISKQGKINFVGKLTVEREIVIHDVMCSVIPWMHLNKAKGEWNRQSGEWKSIKKTFVC